MRVAYIAAAIAAVVDCSAAAPVPIDSSPVKISTPPIAREILQWKYPLDYNVSIRQTEVAAHTKDGDESLSANTPLDVTSASDKAPQRPHHNSLDLESASWERDPADRQHVEHSYKSETADRSSDQTHKLLHTQDGRSIESTDEQSHSAVSFKYDNKRRWEPEELEAPDESIGWWRLENSRWGPISDEAARAARTSGQFAWMLIHNVTYSQAHAATHPSSDVESVPGQPLTDAQVAAIIAANEEPSSRFEGDNKTFPAYDYAAATLRLEQVFTAMAFDMTLDQIHSLFHSEDGNVASVTDKELHEAIAWSRATAGGIKPWAKRDVKDSDYLAVRTALEVAQRQNLTHYNVSATLVSAATSNSNPKPLTDRELVAVIAAGEAPYPLSPDVHSEAEIIRGHQMNQILQVLDVGFGLSEIYSLWHDQNGEPILVSDDEIQTAVLAHLAVDALPQPDPELPEPFELENTSLENCREHCWAKDVDDEDGEVADVDAETE